MHACRAQQGATRNDDNPERYPSKMSIGPLGKCFFGLLHALEREVLLHISILLACVADNITGGFAGGEMGVQQFVETGDITFSDPG